MMNVKLNVNAPTNEKYLTLIRQKQLEMLFNQQPSILIANIIAGTSLFVLFITIWPSPILYAWYGTLMMLTFMRAMLVYKYRKNLINQANQEYFLSYLIIGTIISGTIWGFSWITLSHSETLIGESIILLWICGMCAGSSASLSILKRVYFSFTLPVIIPEIVHLFSNWNTESYLLIYALIIYFGLIIFVALRNHKDLNQSIELQLQNQALVEELNFEKASLLDKNNELIMQQKREVELQKKLLSQEKFAIIGQLAGTISHELRNPLGTLRTSFSIIKHKLEDRSICDIDNGLERIDRNIDRCDRIIGNILDFAKTSPTVLELTDIDPWLDVVLSEIDTPSHVNLHCNLSSGIKIKIDRYKMLRVVINLVENAIQAMEHEKQNNNTGKIYSLDIKTKLVKHIDVLEIRIQDNGPGMSQVELDQAFEPLFSTKIFGVGIGLTIVDKIIKEHKGKLNVKTEIGKATEFIISLPIFSERIS